MTLFILNCCLILTALVAAHAIGDDYLRQQYKGHVEPDSLHTVLQRSGLTGLKRALMQAILRRATPLQKVI
jgi:hypothetical protein